MAANLLADRGWDVVVLDAAPHSGGAVASAELIEPGYINDVFSAFGTETPTDGYFLLNAAAGGEVTGTENAVWFRWMVSANNLLDTEFVSHLSRLKYAPVNPRTGIAGVFNQGRNFNVSIVVPIGL